MPLVPGQEFPIRSLPRAELPEHAVELIPVERMQGRQGLYETEQGRVIDTRPRNTRGAFRPAREQLDPRQPYLAPTERFIAKDADRTTKHGNDKFFKTWMSSHE